jgi:hypothetical protein
VSQLPELFAGAAHDPTAADGLIAWQRPGGALLLGPGGTAAVPGRQPALGAGRVAWVEDDRVVIAEAATLDPLDGIEAPAADAVALSDAWVVWRARDASGADRLHGRAIAGDGDDDEPEAFELAVSRPRAELGRPALAGSLLLFHEAGPGGSRIHALDLATGRRRIIRRESGAMLTNPSTDGTRLLYVRATGRTQELRLGALQRRATLRDRIALLQPSPGQRDLEHEPGKTRHNTAPLPPLARPGVADTLWTTALTSTHAYVTRLRTSRRAARTADILRVPLIVRG